MSFLKGIKKYDYILKTLLLGHEKAGKTIFLKRIWLYENYKDFQQLSKEYRRTTERDFKFCYKKFNDKIYEFQIWDSAGKERFQSIKKAFYKGAHIILIFYDAYDKDSFRLAKSTYKQLLPLNNKAVYFLIRNKYELSLNSEKKEIISDEEALEFADKNNLIFVHLSSFENYGNGIDNLFDIILKENILRTSNI